VPTTYANWIPAPLFSGETISLTLTAIIDILPFACKNASQAQMFGPTQTVSPFSRLGPQKRPASPSTTSIPPGMTVTKVRKGKRARITHPQ
jgi:hypothetical protein